MKKEKGQRYIHDGCGGELIFLGRKEGHKCLKCDMIIPLFPKEWLEQEEMEQLKKVKQK